MFDRDHHCSMAPPRRAPHSDSSAHLRANAYALLSSLYQDQPDAAAGAAGSFLLYGCARPETEVEPQRTDDTLGRNRYSYCGICSANCAWL